MAKQHCAKPWQWETIERKRYYAEFSCLLELRDRIKALEAAAQPAKSNHLEIPGSSLVERVADAIVTKATSAGIVDDRPARAAIREVAAWFEEQGGAIALGWAITLEQEAKR